MDSAPGGIYYWMGKLGHSGGDIIGPSDIGFAGRILHSPVVVSGLARNHAEYLPTQDAPVSLLEVVFELVRLREFPDRPTRFEALFLWDNQDWSRCYHNRASYASLYSVQIAECQKLFKGDYRLITDFQLPDTVRQMEDRARRYWSGEINGRYEVVLQGKVRVASQVA